MGDKKAGVAILISAKIDFKTKTVRRDKEGLDIIKGSIQEEDTTIINPYAPKNRGTSICKANTNKIIMKYF